jgi:hypothetical protein
LQDHWLAVLTFFLKPTRLPPFFEASTAAEIITKAQKKFNSQTDVIRREETIFFYKIILV